LLLLMLMLRSMAAPSSFILIGLLMKSSTPALKHCSRQNSGSKEVMAIILGPCCQRLRMCLVASIPFISGIWISMSTRS